MPVLGCRSSSRIRQPSDKTSYRLAKCGAKNLLSSPDGQAPGCVAVLAIPSPTRGCTQYGVVAETWLSRRSLRTDRAQPGLRSNGKRCQTLEDFPQVSPGTRPLGARYAALVGVWGSNPLCAGTVVGAA